MSAENTRRILDEAGARPPVSSDPVVDGLSPSLVLEPENAEACARAVELCHREDMAIVPMGSATRVGVGNVPSRLDVLLSCRAIRGVSDYLSADFTVAVGAGTSLTELAEVLAPERQFLPVDAPHPDRATVGGVFAMAEPGFRRRPGKRPRDLLLGFEAILADGTPVRAGGRVVKNVAGYELTKLFVGSAGTLAVMTRAFLRVHPIAERESTLLVSRCSPHDLDTALSALERAPVAPEVIALLNPNLAATFSFSGWSLLIRYDGVEEEVRSALDDAERLLSPRPCDRLELPIARDLWSRLRDFPAASGDELALRAQAAPTRTLEVADAWKDGGALVAYPDSGLVYSHTEDPEALGERRTAASRLGANLVVESAPIAVKHDIDVWGALPGGFELMRKIKNELDPKGILSPGRFVGRI